MTTKNKIKLIQVLCLLTIAWLIFLVLTSCETQNRRPKAPETKRMELDSTSQYSDQNYRTYTLEGCEYLVVGSGKERWGSHKGNCKNPIHNDTIKN